MMRYKFIFICFLIFASCNTGIKNDEENQIIYELEEKYSKHIIDYFEAAHENSKNDEYNLKKQFVEIHGIKQSYTIHFDICDDFNKDERYMKLTNRFLKLSDKYFIPIVYSEDDEFSIKEKKDETNVVKSRVGSSATSFIVQEDSIQKLSIM